MKKIKKEVKLLNIIKQIGFDNIDEDKFEKVVSKVFNPYESDLTVISADELGVDITDVGEYFFAIYDKNGKYDLQSIHNILENKIDKSDVKLSSVKKIYLIEIFRSICEKYQLNNDGSRVRKLREIIKNELNNNKVNIEHYNYIIPDNLDQRQQLEIKITDRIRSLEQEYNLSENEKTGKKITMKSYVFTAELDSIIKLYDIFGDDLFAKNVRIGGIGGTEENTGVDNDIKSTYIKEPKEFWFLNNGISLFIETNKAINLNIFDRVKITVDSIEDISIINGAQTMKAVSEARYSEDKQIGERAHVLLRMYIYEKNSEDNDEVIKKIRDFSEKVTVALNKQKPIKQADLAYMTNFVKNIQTIKDGINEKEENKRFTFNFVRRGEAESTVLCQYQLDMFAKIVKAYLLKKPGKARSQSYGTLLKISKHDDGELELAEKEVFKQYFQKRWDEEKHEERKKEFLKYYSPVNFAMKLKDYLEERQEKSQTKFQYIVTEFIRYKEDELDEETKMILKSFAKYGVLVMVSVVINLLNEFKENFSTWEYRLILKDENADENVINLEKLKKLMNGIFTTFNNFTKNRNEKEDVNDSNFWKKDDIINFIIKQLK